MRNITITPNSKDQMNEFVSRLNEANVPHEIVVRLGKPAIRLDESEAIRLLGYEPKKGLRKWAKRIIYAIIILFGLAIIFPVDDSDEGTDSSSNTIPISIIDFNQVDKNYLESIYGESSGIENIKDKYPCEESRCEKYYYSNGQIEAIFEGDLLLTFTVHDSLRHDFNDADLRLLGLGGAAPDFSNTGIKRWDNVKGYEVSCFGVDGKLDYFYVQTLGKKELQALENAPKIEAQFSAWDGSHIKLKQYIKAHMNNPKSFEHADTRYVDKGDYLIVSTSFRGTNAFGGTVLQTVSAKVDMDGNILEIISQ